MKLVVLFCLFFTLTYANTSTPKNILILNSYHQSMNWVQEVNGAILEGLSPIKNELNVHIENMDTKRIHTPEYLESLYKVYIQKYKNMKIDLIIASDDNAFTFLKKYRNEIFGEVPTLFCGVNNYSHVEMLNKKFYSGIIENVDAQLTMNLILKLLPKTQMVYIINDYLFTGRMVQGQIRGQLAYIEDKIQVQYARHQSVEELRESIRNLPKNSVVLLGAFYQGKDGKYFKSYNEIGLELTNDLDKPIFTLYDFYLNGNVIGGKVLSGRFQGEAVAKIALQVLSQNTNVNLIPIQYQEGSKYVLDYDQLKRFNIAHHLIPNNVKILNQPISFYEQHQSVIIPFLIISCFFIFCIIYLLFLVRKKEKSEVRLTQANLDIKRKYNEEKKRSKQKDKTLSQQSQLVQVGNNISKIAHDWRKPLSIISTSASGLKLQKDHGVLDDKLFSSELDNILAQTKHLSQTIDEFRKFTEAEDS